MTSKKKQNIAWIIVILYAWEIIMCVLMDALAPQRGQKKTAMYTVAMSHCQGKTQLIFLIDLLGRKINQKDRIYRTILVLKLIGA
jgi:hypothetical protein